MVITKQYFLNNDLLSHIEVSVHHNVLLIILTSTSDRQTPARCDIANLKTLIVAKRDEQKTDLSKLIQKSVGKVSKKMLEVDLITKEVIDEDPSAERLLEEFTDGVKWSNNQLKVEKHCIKFLKVLEMMKGNLRRASETLRDQWMEAAKCELSISLSLDS